MVCRSLIAVLFLSRFFIFIITYGLTCPILCTYCILGIHRVVSLTLQTSEVGCLTSAVDGTVKLWATSTPPLDSTNSSVSQSDAQWMCLYTFKYRDCPANVACLSLDNSVLAIAYENTLSLWDAQRYCESHYLIYIIYTVYYIMKFYIHYTIYYTVY
jgi:WD40 repeat protein